MSINNREDVNKYYQVINGLVDDYLDKWKVRPSNLKRYLQPGSERFNKFLERNKLKDIKGAAVILKDIIEDRDSMEQDGVITFESFKMFESEEFKIHSLKQCLYKGIEKATQKMEKVLADHFDTNLGDIDIVDADKHIFKVNDWNNYDVEVVIYSKEEMDVILTNVVEHLYGELSKKKIELSQHISIELSDLIKEDAFTNKIENILTEDMAKNLISDCLDNGFKFKAEFQGYFIWIS
jgi:lipopolysaccharide export LptBFGC system permease protein LptF